MICSAFYSLQKAHVQQFVATEDALNKAAEARTTCQQLLKRLHGTADVVSSHSLVVGGTSHSMSSLRQLEVYMSCLALLHYVFSNTVTFRLRGYFVI